MIFGYIEDGQMWIYQNIDEAISDWSSHLIDILGQVVIFYNEKGKYLEPSPVYAKKKWYQFKPSIEHVTFKEKDPIEAHMDKLDYLIHYETISVRQNSSINSLDELKKKIKYEL